MGKAATISLGEYRSAATISLREYRSAASISLGEYRAGFKWLSTANSDGLL
jgi:hypothetical protein